MKHLLSLIIMSLVGSFSIAQDLQPGMAAPALQVGEWVKGTPVNKFNKDSVYVIEFWATWCGPCIQAIPHLTELSKKYSSTHFIGVSVSEANTNLVKPFVDKMGARMGYNVAIDKQETETSRNGFMAKHWLDAAGIEGIPASFVVANNEIVWIGYPMLLDSVLDKVNSRSWDTKAFAEKWKKENEPKVAYKKRLNEYREKMQAAIAAGNKKEFYKLFEDQLNFFTDPKQANWQTVNEMVWALIADPAGKYLTAEMKDYEFAIKWMEKANSTLGDLPHEFFDTLAWSYYGAGNKQKAIEAETKAVSKAPLTSPNRAEYEKALKTFQQ